MTRDYIAIAIAAAFALVGLLPLAGRSLVRPLLWFCLIAGAATGFFAREATGIAWDWLGPIGGLYTNQAAGFAIQLLIGSAIGELLKAMAPLAAVIFKPTDVMTGISFGSAAGAGFGFLITQPVLARVLELVGSPIVTPASTAIAFVGWFFAVLAHIGTTAYVTRAGVRGGLGLAFVFAVLVQFALGLGQKLPVAGGIPIGLLVSAVIAVWLFGYLLAVRVRAASTGAARDEPADP